VPTARIGRPDTGSPRVDTGSTAAAVPGALRRSVRARVVVEHRVWVGAAAAVVAAVVGLLVVASARPTHRVSPTGTAAAPATPPVPSGGTETAADIGPGYVLESPAAGRAVTVLGRWGCGPERPAVLYLQGGAVWVFSAWPTAGQSTRADEAAIVAGATGLAVEPGSNTCDTLLVLRKGRPDVTVSIGAGR
jgi:hypothetical protein